MDICKLIFENIEEKNPSDIIGITPLHLAARYGYLDICRFLIEMAENKNPVNDFGITPFNEAFMSGHTEICNLIKSYGFSI